jgi:predicted transcriptional regulator YdeE
MIIYNRYVNQEDHVWYDSSNIAYSKCYDTQNSKFKTLKIVFKNGRTYVYRNVDADDYIMFKTAESNGQEFHKRIKKYDALRIEDTDMNKLAELQESFKNEIKETDEQKLGDLVYNIKVDENTGEFIIMFGNRILFRGIEGNFSILNLFSSLNIKHTIQRVDELPNDSDENLDKINIQIND